MIFVTVAIALIALGAVLGWAWIDGGEERVRRIEVPVPVPGARP